MGQNGDKHNETVESLSYRFIVFWDDGARSPSEKAVTRIGRAGWAHSLWLNSAPTWQFGEDAKSAEDLARFANGGQRWADGGIARGET